MGFGDSTENYTTDIMRYQKIEYIGDVCVRMWMGSSTRRCELMIIIGHAMCVHGNYVKRTVGNAMMCTHTESEILNATDVHARLLLYALFM